MENKSNEHENEQNGSEIKSICSSLNNVEISDTSNVNKTTAENPTYEVNIPVPWGIISGKWWGPRNQRPILCIHGWQDNAGTFDPLMTLMPKNKSFLCIDLPGHGLSTHLPKGVPYYLWWDGVIYVRRIVKHFGWNKVSILGHSLGAGIGYMYAGVYPNEIDLLISLDTIAPIFTGGPEKIVDTIPEIIENKKIAGLNAPRQFTISSGRIRRCSLTSMLRNMEQITSKIYNVKHKSKLTFLEYDHIEDKKDPRDNYEGMVDIMFNGHKGTLTHAACEAMVRRGMRSHSKNEYKFTRDNRLKVGWLGSPSIEVITELARRIVCRYLNIKCVPGRTMDNIVIYRNLLNIIEQNSEYCKIHFIDGNHHVHLNEPSKVASIINDFLMVPSGNI